MGGVVHVRRPVESAGEENAAAGPACDPPVAADAVHVLDRDMERQGEFPGAFLPAGEDVPGTAATVVLRVGVCCPGLCGLLGIEHLVMRGSIAFLY